jgi:cell division protein FtsW (lipid II flippase)
MKRLLAEATIRLAAMILPAHQRDWGRAMMVELAALETRRAAFAFARGCLVGAVRQAVSAHLHFNHGSEGTSRMHQGRDLLRHPRRLAALCAIGATGLGLAYMNAAGAPLSYLAVNAAALAIGFMAVGVLTEAGRLWRIGVGGVSLPLACLLLLTGLFGVSADGVTRWISAGGLLLQPGLFLVPAVALSFTRARDAASLIAVVIAALALALQPDRAMAGALAAGMAALALARPERTVLTALGAALAAFAVTMVRVDTLPAMPFVDGIFYSSFGVHPLAGFAILAGAGLMLVPALAGYLGDSDHRAAYAVFGAVWLAVILAAALGNYPTPLVGYSGSAIFGYVISLLGLPPRIAVRAIGKEDAAVPTEPEGEQGRLRAGLAVAR